MPPHRPASSAAKLDGPFAATPGDFWTRPADTYFSALPAHVEGLTATEARRRRKRFGANVVAENVRRHILIHILKRLMEPLVAIFIIAATLAGALGDWASSLIIIAMLVMSVALEAFQEHRADLAADKLRRSVAVRSRVRRDGKLISLPVADIVPGDIVELGTGTLIPADGIVIESHGAQADESLLTGEPFPVHKKPGPSAALSPAEAFNAFFSGTTLVSGSATMLVVATGTRTRFGAIAAALETEGAPTAFQRGLHDYGILILRLTGFLVLIVLLAHLAFGRPVLDSFMFAMALAIGLTPQLLPMIRTVTLSRGALRLAARKVVVKRLAAIHDFGSMDVLCTDKTGTLTQASITVVGHPGMSGSDSARVLELAAVNSRFGGGVKSALDDAILARAGDRSLASWRHISEVPFDFERRRVSVLVDYEDRRLLIVKGAPEGLLKLCTAVEDADGSVTPIGAPDRARLQAHHDDYAARGLRCLGIAWKSMPSRCSSATTDDETNLVLAGYCLFEDPPKHSAAGAVARLAALGVRVKIVSGDAPLVIRHLVNELKLSAQGMLTGPEIDKLSDIALANRVEDVDLFARVAPEQKTRIIRALQARGHVVGFLGDGINDAPAIRAADPGVSVEGGADVARAAADMILLDSDLGVLADGVMEGRRTYANIMKYVRMGTSSSFGNTLSMALASIVIPFLPLTPIQVLLNDLIYDVSETGIPFDRVDDREIARPHAWDMRGVLRFTMIMGPLSSAFDIAAFVCLLLVFNADPATFRTAWFLESISTQILVIFLIRSEAPFWQNRPHRMLAATSLAALALSWAVALGPLAGILGFVALPWPLIGFVVALVVAYLVAVAVAKPFAMRSAG